MSDNSRKHSEEFLLLSDQFRLGALITESSHPVTSNLSQVARSDISAALKLLFEVDDDVVQKYREFAESGLAQNIAATVHRALENGGKIFFTGCGSTGRLSIQLTSIWRDFWQRRRAGGLDRSGLSEEFENRAYSVMAGGDYALIKAVEGFEDFAEFGKKQLGDLGVSARDVVFAITEGGETSFVIGTAWKAVEVGATVYFVYNNPDEVLCQHVQRSREVIQEPRIRKINLTTGPMGITGSTRMQATSIQLCVLLSVLEMVLRDLLRKLELGAASALESENVPEQFFQALRATQTSLKLPGLLAQLGRLVALEESVYRAGHKNNYFASDYAIDVLTDTTERSPTYCTPAFRKFDDLKATESWAFLFVPRAEAPQAWQHILKREARCVAWSESEIEALVGRERAPRVREIVRQINCPELMRFRVGLDGLHYRRLLEGDCAVGIVSQAEKGSLLASDGFHRVQLEAARNTRAKIGLVYCGSQDALNEIGGFISDWHPDCPTVLLAAPRTDFLLDGVTRVGLKMLLNALSTCTMVRLGRVMGNCMVWVVPSNLKLIDRSTRYIQSLTGLDYGAANRLLFEVIEYVEPRMKADQAYPPVVALSVLRFRHGIENEQAETRLASGEW
jgi:N-acetylmuramic acid 6-phosphate etherase